MLRYAIRFIDENGVVRWEAYEKNLTLAKTAAYHAYLGSERGCLVLILDMFTKQGYGHKVVASYGGQ